MAPLRYRADLLKDVNERECASSLAATLNEVDPSMSVREVVDVSLATDENLKRLRVLQVCGRGCDIKSGIGCVTAVVLLIRTGWRRRVRTVCETCLLRGSPHGAPRCTASAAATARW